MDIIGVYKIILTSENPKSMVTLTMDRKSGGSLLSFVFYDKVSSDEIFVHNTICVQVCKFVTKSLGPSVSIYNGKVYQLVVKWVAPMCVKL